MNAIQTSRAATALAVLVVCGAGCSNESERQVAAQGSNATMLIEPNNSVGPIRSGMTAQEVVRQFGEPDRRTANALEYTRLGLAVMPGPDGVVQVVMCGDVIGIDGPLVKAFKGRTKEGIGMNSTRQEVVAAYGEPNDSQKISGGLESLRYDGIGITFTLEGGKVHHMIIRLGPPEPPDRTVKLVPAPATAPK